MRINESKSLQDLTNKFLREFMELAHAEKVAEKLASDNPKSVSAKRDDSYEFNKCLPEYIVQSDFVQKLRNDDYPLIGSGFVGECVKAFFQNNIKGIAMDLKYIITNFNKQDTNLDYTAKDYKVSSEKKTVKDWNVESFRDKTQPTQIDVEKLFKTESMTIHNYKSGYVGRCVIKSEDGDLKEILIYGESNTKDLQVKIRYRAFDENGDQEETNIEHLKHVADINSFFMMVEQIIYGIQETIKEKQPKK